MSYQGIVSCGHPLTAQAAEQILHCGGNAFDAVIAAQWMACVCEPVLASLGGGGFLLARHGNKTDLYDFFAQTPRQKSAPDNLDFKPIQADFGPTTQEFHIGWGSVATPGLVKGLFEVHRELGTLPMQELIQPAVHAARTGVSINAFQSYLFSVVRPILLHHHCGRSIYEDRAGHTLQTGALYRNTDLADTMEQLAKHGESWFYQGTIAQAMAIACRDNGGILDLIDFQNYRVVKRKPLRVPYRQTNLYTNPAPSCGGLLLGFALKLLDPCELKELSPWDQRYLHLLSQTMRLSNEARLKTLLQDSPRYSELLADPFVHQYRKILLEHQASYKGTTHINVADKNSNIASVTLSNGEGCGYMLDSTGIMLNNMLGEEDLNPGGFFHWPADSRLASMMAPSFLEWGHTTLSLGSGGSNRIRTAMLQVLLNLVDFKMDLATAVSHPRLHWENHRLDLEPGLELELELEQTQTRHWDQKNLFFGGVHVLDVVQRQGVGDERRAGVCLVVE